MCDRGTTCDDSSDSSVASETDRRVEPHLNRHTREWANILVQVLRSPSRCGENVTNLAKGHLSSVSTTTLK